MYFQILKNTTKNQKVVENDVVSMTVWKVKDLNRPFSHSLYRNKSTSCCQPTAKARHFLIILVF